MGCLVSVDWEPHHCDGSRELLASRGTCTPYLLAKHVRESQLVRQIIYFGRCIPWIIIDAIPYFRKWKLQPNKIPTPAEQWECTRQVLFSHFTIELPAVSV